MEQLYRQDLILGLLPNKENALNSSAIHERVTNQGIDVDKRTILRDLSDLELNYPHVHSRPKGKAKLWWAEKSLSRLSMLPTDAMNLVMIMDHAARFGMEAQVQKLTPLREYAIPTEGKTTSPGLLRQDHQQHSLRDPVSKHCEP